MAKRNSKVREFVLSHPKLTANEVQAAAKSHGIDVSRSYIYMVRSSARRVVQPKQPKRAATVATISTRAEQERELVGIAADLGLARSEKLLSQIRRTLAANLRSSRIED